ncbi:hypothetical protein HERIO_1720 [Hepatospora eriocheir]|uniref:Uncharacterized protein n=1 Tax=Hepatospora eriocheir TaxID=1081669 RepID=A0A1X0Q980_9MICR|nr:hypothetical protein HERIO_1720 [Hepatospora eriocheir]
MFFNLISCVILLSDQNDYDNSSFNKKICLSNKSLIKKYKLTIKSVFDDYFEKEICCCLDIIDELCENNSSYYKSELDSYLRYYFKEFLILPVYREIDKNFNFFTNVIYFEKIHRKFDLIFKDMEEIFLIEFLLYVSLIKHEDFDHLNNESLNILIDLIINKSKNNFYLYKYEFLHKIKEHINILQNDHLKTISE